MSLLSGVSSVFLGRVYDHNLNWLQYQMANSFNKTLIHVVFDFFHVMIHMQNFVSENCDIKIFLYLVFLTILPKKETIFYWTYFQ